MFVVYRHFDKDGKLLYVGQTQDEKNRRSQHKYHSFWFDDIARVTTEPYATRNAALSAEEKAITGEKPLYNNTPSWVWPLAKDKKALLEARDFHAQFLSGSVVSAKEIRIALRNACNAVGSPTKWSARYKILYREVMNMLGDVIPITKETQMLFNVRALPRTYFVPDED